MFFSNGFGYGSWIAHLPAFKAQLGVSDGPLGFALLVVALTSVAAMPLAGVWIGRHGSRRIAGVMAIVASATLVLPFLATTYVEFVLSGILIGAAYSTMDVSMNAQGIVVERGAGRPIMSSFHATFSVGGLVGSIVSTILLARFASLALDGTLVAIACCALAIVSYRALAEDPPEPAHARAQRRNAYVATAALGAIAFFGLLGEGAMADWSGIYLRNLGSGIAAAAGGFGAFSIAMATGRGFGDAIVARVGARRTVVGGALLAAISLACALAFPTPWVAFVAFASVGLGLANVIPVLFSAAGRVPGVPSGVGIASVSTIGYAGFLFGPPAIGFTSDAIGLRIALGLVVAAICTVALIARGAIPEPAS